ncbi:MAG TPA: rubrerythrin family protein [bacterium]|nr:rubrerythrin family protein [bacterium]
MSTQKTPANLQSAFAGESMANRKYLYFAKLAREKGDEEVAKLFEETAHQETAHAFGHLELIYPKDKLTVADLLRIAMEGELYETNQMYPEFERVARDEKEAAAVTEFKEQANESAEHAQLFRKQLEKAEKRFMALGLVEAKHAARYGEALAKLAGDSKEEAR